MDVGVGGGGVSVGTGPDGSKYLWWRHHPHHPYHPWHEPFIYRYAASQDQLRDDPNVALFFLEKDLHPSKKLNLHFTKTTSGAKLLPRHVAETIPFSSNEFSDILNRFSVEPGSAEALEMKKTIEECEVPAMEGEDKYCATSLEAMVDYSTSKLGKNVKVMATEVGKEESPQQEFTISPGVTKMVGDKRVVCHGQNYPYAVFHCHASHATKAYLVPMVGADGTKVKAVAACHIDPSKWNPRHLAFQVLKVKPGMVPICHFLPEDHIVWTSK